MFRLDVGAKNYSFPTNFDTMVGQYCRPNISNLFYSVAMCFFCKFNLNLQVDTYGLHQFVKLINQTFKSNIWLKSHTWFPFNLIYPYALKSS